MVTIDMIDKKREAFDLIDKVGDLSQDVVEEYYSALNVEYVNILYKELTGNICGDIKNSKEFSESVIQLRKIKRFWGRRLGEVFIAAGKLFDEGHVEDAIEILNKFLNECDSPFHVEHVKNQIFCYEKSTKGGL